MGDAATIETRNIQGRGDLLQIKVIKNEKARNAK
jgi:hypothetical protein